MKRIGILGSTGSIGSQTLDIVREHKDLKISTLAAAGNNLDLLERQVREYQPSFVCVYDETAAKELKNRLKDISIKVLAGMDGLIACATENETDLVITAMVGMIGIQPTIEAIKAGKDIALANKETLVTAGHIIMPLIKEKQVSLFPVDSEHSAIFQSLKGEDISKVYKILLTASGGPFRGKKLADLGNVTLDDALKHPNWAMGRKITIDSATMVNKGLEVIEAKWLFNVEIDSIQVLVHPQSIIHSMVEFMDGSIIGQMGTPDMRLPIQYALYYPERKRLIAGERVDFIKLSQLTFEEPDMETFLGLKLGYEAGRIGGSMPTVYNAANEWAVARFLEGKIDFLTIPKIINAAMENHKLNNCPSVNEILNIEVETYDFVKDFIKAELSN